MAPLVLLALALAQAVYSAPIGFGCGSISPINPWVGGYLSNVGCGGIAVDTDCCGCGDVDAVISTCGNVGCGGLGCGYPSYSGYGYGGFGCGYPGYSSGCGCGSLALDIVPACGSVGCGGFDYGYPYCGYGYPYRGYGYPYSGYGGYGIGLGFGGYGGCCGN